jgi:hypothetical protein
MSYQSSKPYNRKKSNIGTRNLKHWKMETAATRQDKIQAVNM